MITPLQSLIASGSKIWLDSVDPDLVQQNADWGVTGATSNPAIVSGLVRSGRFDGQLPTLIDQGLTDEEIAWELTDRLVHRAQEVFFPSWELTKGDDGYVSFELDPLIDAVDSPLSVQERTARYVELGKKWSAGHLNRMIKVPATEAGLAAIEELCAAGVTLNITLIFTRRQYELAREAMYRGAALRDEPLSLKSVYSLFISRIDVYTETHVPELSAAAQGEVGILNARRIWRENQQFWRGKGLPLNQEIVFASTGTKKPDDPPDKYVAALAGSDIQTNPPETNAAVQALGKTYPRTVDRSLPEEVVSEIAARVDVARMERVLMEEGLDKFATPQKNLQALIASRRRSLDAGS